MFDFEPIKKMISGVYDMVAAYQFNQNKGYSKNAIKIIRVAAGAAPLDYWDVESVNAIYKWQASPSRLKPLTADGMFGPKSLGVLIAELEKKGDAHSTAILRQFPHKNVKSGQVESTAPGREVLFFRYPGRPLMVRPHPLRPNAWEMRGSFRVELFIDRGIVEPWRYEYRQYIRGRAIIHNTAGDNDAREFFKVPGGLDPHFFKEDGEIMPDGSIERFGYRKRHPRHEAGLMDIYSENQQGWEYRLEDTYGVAGNNADASKVTVEMVYRGVVIKDGKELTSAQINSGNWKDYCVAGDEWTCFKEEYLSY